MAAYRRSPVRSPDRFTVRRRAGSHGFTLTELVVVVTIVGILAAIAGPAMVDFVIKQRIRNAGYDLISDLIFARSEAVKRNTNVTVAKVGTWTGGWTVKDAGGNVLRQHPAFADTITITGSNASVVFSLEGRASASSTFTIDDADGKASIEAHCVALDPSGRARSVSGTCS